MQAKYKSSGADAPASSSTAPAPSAPKAEPEDANALAAMAMQAMLSGDMALYNELDARLKKVQAEMASAASAKGGAEKRPAEVPRGPRGEKIEVIEEVDAAGRSRALLATVEGASVRTKGRNQRGTANAVPSKKGEKAGGYYEDDDVSLEDLIRREKIEGVQDYEENLRKHIVKKGTKFQMLHEDEDEAYALGWYEGASKKMDAKKLQEVKGRQQAQDKRQIQVNLERCGWCMESKRFRHRASLLSSAAHTYLCVESFEQCILPGQVCIVPMEHTGATTEADESVWTEIRNYQKSLVRFFDAEDPPKAVIFVESAVQRVSRDKALLGAGPHTCVVCYPIELDRLEEAKAYWKKALDESECEFAVQHKKVIPVDPKKGGLRGAIPKGFPYVYVDFSLGGGFAHIVDDANEFRNFAQHTVAGMCELTILDRAYASRDTYRSACDALKQRFAAGFDWAEALRH